LHRKMKPVTEIFSHLQMKYPVSAIKDKENI